MNTKIRHFLIHSSTLLVFCILLSNSLNHLISQSLYIDESYYIGAARAILDGDIFLTTYKFDKPFLLPFWYLPGLITFGFNGVGFRFVSLVCLFVAFKYLKKIFSSILTDEKISLSGTILAGAFLTVPIIYSYTLSAFAEPFLLVMFSIWYWKLWESSHSESDETKKISILYFIGLFTKFSLLMWFPVMFFYWLLKKEKRETISQGILKLFSHTWPIWTLGLFYGLTNRKKFAAYTWFKSLTQDHAASSSNIFGRLWDWIQIFVEVHTLKIAFSIILTFVLVMTIYLTKRNFNEIKSLFKLRVSNSSKRSEFKDLILIHFPFWLHLFGIALSNAQMYQRYLYILIPQFFLITLSSFYWLKRIHGNNKYLKQFLIPVVVTVFVVFSSKWQEAVFIVPKEHKDWGRIYSYIEYELNSDSILHPDKAWELLPYDISAQNEICLHRHCLLDRRKGLKYFANQFIVDGDKEEAPLVKIAPLSLEESVSKKEISIKHKYLIEKIKSGSKFGKKMILDQIETAHEVSKVAQKDLPESSNWVDFLGGQKVILHMSHNKRKYLKVKLKGSLRLTTGKVAKDRIVNGQSLLVFRIEKITLTYKGKNYEITDLSPVLFKSYFLPLGRIAFNLDRSIQVTGVEISPNYDAISIKYFSAN